MKRNKILLPVFSILLFTSIAIGCNPTKDNINLTPPPPIESEYIQDEIVDYKAIYKEQLNSLINKYGKYQFINQNSPIVGVKYAQLLYLDTDNIPELLVSHDKEVLIYNIKNNKANLIYEKTAGVKYGQNNPAYHIAVNDTVVPNTVIFYDSAYPWRQENIILMNLDKDTIVTRNLFARAPDSAEMFARENLTSFYIDNEECTKAEYYSIYNSIVSNSKLIEVTLDIEPAKLSNLENFINSLN